MNIAEDLEPTYQEVKKRPDWPKWQEAKNGTYQTGKKQHLVCC